MSCLTAYWPVNGRLELWAAFGDTPSLLDRGRADRVGGLYEVMRERGELWTHPGRLVNVGAFVRDVAEALEGADVKCIGSDRARKAEFLEAIRDSRVRWPPVARGTGCGWSASVKWFRSGTPRN